MNALVLRQPWPLAIFHGVPDPRAADLGVEQVRIFKRLEIRSWRLPLKHRGTRTLIVAGREIDYEGVARLGLGPAEVARLELGCAYGTLTFAGSREMRPDDAAAALVPYRRHLCAWSILDPLSLTRRFPVRGRQGFFDVDVMPSETVGRIYP